MHRSHFTERREKRKQALLKMLLKHKQLTVFGILQLIANSKKLSRLFRDVDKYFVSNILNELKREGHVNHRKHVKVTKVSPMNKRATVWFVNCKSL